MTTSAACPRSAHAPLGLLALLALLAAQAVAGPHSGVGRHFAAQTPVSLPGARQPERFMRGQALATRTHCGSCHLPSYVGREQMPRLAGQREDYLLHSMKQFVDGSATGRDTIMAASLHGMREEDLRDLAHYLSQLR